MKSANILLVEDDQLDVIDIKRSLEKANIVCRLFLARNGEEAVTFLQSCDSRVQPLPDFLLIDINMPKMNGLELLEAIRQNANWKHLKCFIITTSDAKVDRLRAASLNVSGYIIKPLKLTNPATMDGFNLMIDLMNF